MKQGQAGESSEVPGKECALRGKPAQSRLPARYPGLSGADGHTDPLDRRVDGAGKKEQAASDSAAHIENAKLLLLHGGGHLFGLGRDESVNVIHRFLESSDTIRPDCAPNGEGLPPDPHSKKEPRVGVVVRLDGRAGVCTSTMKIAPHDVIVPVVAKRCKTM